MLPWKEGLLFRFKDWNEWVTYKSSNSKYARQHQANNFILVAFPLTFWWNSFQPCLEMVMVCHQWHTLDVVWLPLERICHKYNYQLASKILHWICNLSISLHIYVYFLCQIWEQCYGNIRKGSVSCQRLLQGMLLCKIMSSWPLLFVLSACKYEKQNSKKNRLGLESHRSS